MKHYFYVTFCTIFLCATLMVGYYTMPNSNQQENELLLANIEALSQSSEEVIYDYKITSSCDCWDGMEFRGMAILDCQKYVWCAPMVKQNCSRRSCPNGSSC